jgi:tRNA A37 threonylcarbamoyladenosine dehydratase
MAPMNKNRFGGVARVFGDAGLRRIAAARVAVIGLGGWGEMPEPPTPPPTSACS